MAGRPTKVTLTEAVLRGLAPKANRYAVWDKQLNGFAVLVHPSGRKVFVVKVRLGERGVVTRSLGVWPALRAEDARKRARVVLGMLTRGEDPKAHRSAPEKAPLDRLFAEWLEHARTRLRPRSLREVERIWRKYLSPRLGRRSLTTLSPQLVTAVVQGIAEQHGPIQANRARAWLNVVVNHARKMHGLDISNPVVLAPKYTEVVRTRFLSLREAVAFYAWCVANPFLSDPLAMMLLLGVRQGTLRAGGFEQIDWQARLWEIPGEAMKSGRPHTLPLPRQVVELLERRRRAALPWPRPSEAALRRVRVELGLAWLRQHDLRRTFAALLTALGAPTTVVAHLLGHSLPPGLTVTAGIYALPSIEVLRDWTQRLANFLETEAMKTSTEETAAPGRNRGRR